MDTETTHLRARFRTLERMLRTLERCAETSRRRGEDSWAEDFGHAAEALEELAMRLEMAIEETEE